jgi:hypothetical protein
VAETGSPVPNQGPGFPDVRIIAKTVVDWKTFLWAAKEERITSSTDAKNMKPNYLCALAEFDSEGTDPIKALRVPGYIGRHLFYSFIVTVNSPFRLLKTDLRSLVRGDKVILTGDLNTWIYVIELYCSEDKDADLRYLFNLIQMIFETEGYQECFSGLKKVMLHDRTYKLVPK